MNAIEMADNYKKKLEENKRNYIANIVSNDRRSLNDIVDSYITNFNGNRNSSYYKNEYKNEINKRNQLQKNIQKSTYEKGVQTTVTPFSTQRNILPIQEQSEITKSKKFEITAGQDKLKQNKDIEKKYQDIQQTNEYKKQMKELEEQSNKVGYAKYEYEVVSFKDLTMDEKCLLIEDMTQRIDELSDKSHDFENDIRNIESSLPSD